MNPADPYGLQGQVLDGQFRVDRFVGEGGFSVVYRGHHVGLDEPIAIKCLKLPGALGSALVESFVRRFRDESRLHYRLSQGNLAIVRSIASGTTMSPSTSALVPYMVLEWLEGRSLAQEFDARKQQGLHGRTLDETVKVLDSAAQGLAFAHAQGVIHRDINPGNLFLASTRQGPITKLLDFGVAKVISDHALEMGPRAQTIGHIRIFAPAYGSPEQFDDSVGKVGPASDVYSIALIALEMMRDQPVREGEHIGEFAMMALDVAAKPTPRALGIPVGDAVEEAFGRAVAMRPEDRFSDVGGMWGALKNAMRVDAESGRAPFANPGSARGSQWKPHAPAAGQPVADRPVTADMQAPIVEVARPGSIAPPPPDAGALSYQPSRAGRVSNQTVRMQRPGEPSELTAVPPGTVSGASALGATPLTSTLMMMDAPGRILTPVPPTTRTGQMPEASPMAQSRHMGTPDLGSTARMQASQTPAPAPVQAPQGYGPPPALQEAQGTGPVLLRSEVPTVVPPKPTSRATLAIVIALVIVAVLAGVAFAAYRFVFAQGSSAPVSTVTAATVVPPATAPAPTAEPVAVAPVAVPTVAEVPTAVPTATNPVAPVATTSGHSTPTSTSTQTSPQTSTPAPTPTSAAHGFDPAAARKSLDVMNGVLASCRAPGGRTGQGPINVTFGPDGHVLHAVVDEPPFAGTSEAQCVASRFKMAKMAPFEGQPGSLVYTFHIPQ